MVAQVPQHQPFVSHLHPDFALRSNSFPNAEILIFMPLVTPPIKNIREITEPLKEQILKGDVHTIDEMRAWLKPLGYRDTINEAAINFILREFVMSKVPSGSLCNAEMIVESLRPQLEVTTKDIEPVIIMGLYHHRDLIGSRDAFMRVI